MYHVYIVIIVACFGFYEVTAKPEGSHCTHNGKYGVCTLAKNCQSALDAIANGGHAQICSYKGTQPIVCCINSRITNTQTPAPTQKSPATSSLRPVTEGCEDVSPHLTAPKTGRKAWDNCIEYQKKLVYPCVKNVALIGGMVRSNRCYHNANQLIVGGVTANRREFPHMVHVGYAIGESIEWKCGGSLISERFILTAGHCTYDRSGFPASYILLSSYKGDIKDPSKMYTVKRIIKHPEYKPPSKYNDIALLETETEMKLSEEAVPACLHVDTTAPDEKAVATGWGKTSGTGPLAVLLQKVTLNRFSYKECRETFKPERHLKNGIDEKTQICYGAKHQSKDTCQGDSGGPLQIKNQKITCMYTIIGVTSVGHKCGVGEPAVYTKVSHYVPWIESVVWP